MSELKAYTAPNMEGRGLTDYYLKSEADKVIAEKDKEIAELQKQVHDYAQDMSVVEIKNEEARAEVKAALELVKKANALCKEAK